MWIELTECFIYTSPQKKLINLFYVLEFINIEEELMGLIEIENERYIEGLHELRGKGAKSFCTLQGGYKTFLESCEEIHALIRRERTNQWGH